MDKMFEKLDMGNVSDGYHTFNELYRYRMLYNAAFFNELAKGDVGGMLRWRVVYCNGRTTYRSDLQSL